MKNACIVVGKEKTVDKAVRLCYSICITKQGRKVMKRLAKILSVMLAVSTASLVFLAGCNDEKPDPDKEYTIQYPWNGTQSIKVKSGDLFSISEIPQKVGYTFTGLWDSPTDGTQYVSETGNSLKGFSANKNMVLYPQFTVKEYTLVLDYQGAPVSTGIRSMEVEYNTQLSALPIQLQMENKTFTGWYTKPNKEGIQVSDQYGNIPSKDVVREDIFDLNDPHGYIYLYAGFKAEEHTVRLYYSSYTAPEEVKVEHDTYVKDIVTDKRVDGKAVYSWTKTSGGTEVFDGKITGETSLYALEFAPVLDFDTDGGTAVKPIVARAGDAISLPTPEKENYAFGGWTTKDGTLVNYTVMPESGERLTAVWKPMMVFDTRGGTAVENISMNVGEKVTLPTPNRDGYIFAGWYTQDGDKYTETAMPSVSMKLSAKWYKVKTAIKVFIKADTSVRCNSGYTSPLLNVSANIDLNDLPISEGDTIRVKGGVLSRIIGSSIASPANAYIAFYSSNTLSDAYLLSKEEVVCTTGNEYGRFIFETTWKYAGNINACFYAKKKFFGGYVSAQDFYFSDLYVEIEYPDKTELL